MSITFRSEMQRPSSAKLWQMPQPAALPIIPLFFPREVPLEAHETSYFADSAKYEIYSAFILQPEEKRPFASLSQISFVSSHEHH